MQEEHCLVNTNSALCTIEQPEEDNVFRMFRRVYMAERCQKRLVYWFEHRFGQTILRQRIKKIREAKKHDKVVATFPGIPNVDAMRLSIAASQSRRLMTGIRWELYADFNCMELVEMGRFDVVDLIGEADTKRLEWLAKTGTITLPTSAEDWDYDAFLLTHRCPKCNKMYGRETLVFNPEFSYCTTCRAKKDACETSDTLIIAGKLLRLINDEPVGVFDTLNELSNHRQIEKILDVHATPLITWLCSTPAFQPTWIDLERKDLPGGFLEADVRRCYQKSLFPLFKIQALAEEFERFFTRQTEALIRDLESRKTPVSLTGMDAEQSRNWSIHQNRESLKDLKKMVRAIQQHNQFMQVPYSRMDKMNWEMPLAEMWEVIKYLPLYVDDALIHIGRKLTQQLNGKETENT